MRHVMRLAAFVSFAFLLGPISAFAQSPTQPQSANTVISAQTVGPPQSSNSVVLQKLQKPGASCPVALRAQHGADGTVRKVDRNRPEGIAQLLHLILSSKNSRQIVEAHLRVRGASGKGQLHRTDAAPSGIDATRNVTVKLRQSAENEASGDVWVPEMSAVLEVEVNSVKFADGGMQRFGTADGCRFTPEHLMLISKD